MDTSAGRFISQDSYEGDINDPVSLHKYLYCGSNPVMYSDPSGNIFIETIGSVVSFGISTVAESQYNKAIVATGLVLLTELVYLLATHESLILTSLQYYWELADKCISGLITWCSANISIAADKIMRVKDEEAANEMDKLKRQYPQCTIIYRKGSGTYTNLTPREKDIKGLSYQLTIPIVTPYTFTAIELIEKTATLEAKVDGVDHVSVYPTFMFTMQQWIDSRSDAENNPHPYSVLLRSISVRVG